MPDMYPVTIETLRELRLTTGEFGALHSLAGRGEGDIENPDAHRAALDMLVLSGLIQRLSVVEFPTGERVRWTNQWALTPEGAETVGHLDMNSNWDAFAFSDLSSKKINKD